MKAALWSEDCPTLAKLTRACFAMNGRPWMEFSRLPSYVKSRINWRGTMWEKPVYSSMVALVGYDEDKRELYVVWTKSGRRSIYSGVDEETATALASAPSVGQMINSEIK